MNFKPPKDDARCQWTNHVKGKMMQYRISESLIKRIIRSPRRMEEGIAEHTIGVMQPGGMGKRKHEVWVMYRRVGQKIKIISAWRYPGTSPAGKPIYIPEDVLEELANDKV